MSLKLVEGDLFQSKMQTLVNTVNCKGAMGKGIALEFKKRYPKMYEKYKVLCDKRLLMPGKLWLYKADDGKWILNFPTKDDWRQPSRLGYIAAGLQKFYRFYKEKGITSIAFPMLGCNNGGLDKKDVLMLMEQYLGKCNECEIEIYI